MIESSFSKLFSSLVTSTVWLEDDATRIVWITILALKNRNGEVAASIPGLAHSANVSVPACRKALATLSGPDPDSRTKDHEGRRIAAIPGGWRVLNHFKYRDAMSQAERKASKAEWQRRYRLRNKGERGQDSGRVLSTWTHTDTDTDTEQIPVTKPRRQRMKPRTASPTCNHAASVNLCESCAPAMQGFHDSGNPA
jgi:hypothetical protein